MRMILLAILMIFFVIPVFYYPRRSVMSRVFFACYLGSYLLMIVILAGELSVFTALVLFILIATVTLVGSPEVAHDE